MIKEIIVIRRTSLKSSAMGFGSKPEFILAYLSAINYHPVLVKPLKDLRTVLDKAKATKKLHATKLRVSK